jgi:SAM-dependent methyltransferase
MLRLVRRLMPGAVMRLLLRAGIGVEPGLETRQPRAAADRYLKVLGQHNLRINGWRVMVFGYGGHLGLGLELLRSGAAQVVLLDPYATPKLDPNAALLRKGEDYLEREGEELLPNPEHLVLSSQTIEAYAATAEPMDLVLSSSVYEHLRAPDRVTKQLARIMRPMGYQLHFIDLRDHFFKYPFEMLCHSEGVWSRFLNPPSNLNRLRLRDYQALFQSTFERVDLEILESDQQAFERARPRIRTEFLSGDIEADAATRVRVWLEGPRSS